MTPFRRYARGGTVRCSSPTRAAPARLRHSPPSGTYLFRTIPTMTRSNRRDFLRLAAGTAGAATLNLFPPVIRDALAIPANRRTGTIRDIEHVVILMQENRSFDHYFGTLRGVRG